MQGRGCAARSVMKHNDPERVEHLFHAALELDAAERRDYLVSACLDDKSLCEEVESLLAAYEDGNGFIEEPAFDLGMKLMSSSSRAALTGDEIGEYRILKRLGKGGMGEVYLAQDTRLERQVALKFLSPEFVGDRWAKRQLIKEAQSVAALDHPNICSVHGIEEIGEHSFIVMQYVEGETLADLIRARSLSAGEVLPLGHQIISAIAEAHAHGIIHRDIKPKNIMVTPGLSIKVLDFGLAKTIKKTTTKGDSVSEVSQVNVIPGTVAYMSPEQLRGEELDYRSDIFSLGTVFYEMVGGKNPFARANSADVISSILTSDPPALKETNYQTPRELDRIVRKCLQKDRRQRYQSASELLIEWDSYANAINSHRSRPWQFVLRWVAAAIVLLLCLAVVVYFYSYWTRQRTLAILPITNDTGDPSLDYLAEGLTESAINQLSGRTKLKVKAFSMVSGYNKREIDPQKVGQELYVDEIVLGKVEGTRNSLRLEILMIDTKDGSQHWAKRYSMDPGTIFSVVTELSKDLTSILEPWSRGNESQLQSARQTINPEARNEYMLGKYYWRKRDNNTTLKQAIEHFNTAIKLQPNYAEAYAGLADCYLFTNVVSYPDLGLNTAEAMQRAERAAKDAVALDENLAEAHTSLGYVYLKSHWDWLAAEREFKRAIELKPDYDLAYFGYSNLRTITGPQSEAIALSRKAKELDPFSPVAALNFCRSYYYARRYDEASDCFDKLVEDNPEYTNGQYSRAFVYLKRGLNSEAIRILEELYAKDKRSAAAALGYAYGIADNKEAAQRVLAEMENLSERSYIPPQEFVLVYLGLRDDENTFLWLNRAADEHFAPTAYIAVDPMYDPIRSDPRFIDLAKKLNLPH